MNARFVKFLIGLSLCLLGMYLLFVNIVDREVLLPSFGIWIPPFLTLITGFGIIFAGMRLLRQVVIEEWSVTSD